MIEPGSIQVCGLCCVSGIQVVYANSVIPYCLFKHYILFVMRHYSEYSNCNSIYMICPCSDSTSALEPDSVHCTQEAVGMPVNEVSTIQYRKQYISQNWKHISSIIVNER